MDDEPTYTAFAGDRLIVSAGLETMLFRTKEYLDGGGGDRVLIFDDRTGRQVDFDFRGTPEEVLQRAAPEKPRTGPGRPKLGVISREVSLLPRHWDWLESQPQGISGRCGGSSTTPGSASRARRPRGPSGRPRAISCRRWRGTSPASRRRHAPCSPGIRSAFEELIRDWPEDIRGHLTRQTRESMRLETADTPPDAPSA